MEEGGGKLCVIISRLISITNTFDIKLGSHFFIYVMKCDIARDKLDVWYRCVDVWYRCVDVWYRCLI